eukprot:7546851-Ditylum_brightwellii.AAC.1
MQTQKSNFTMLAGEEISSSGSGCKQQSARFTKDEFGECFSLKKGSACDVKQKVGRNWSKMVYYPCCKTVDVLMSHSL